VVDQSVFQWVLDDREGTATPLFERTVEEAKDILKRLPPGSTAGLILADATPAPVAPHLGSSLGKLYRHLDEIEPSYDHADLATGVLAARDLLLEEGLEHRDIYVVAPFSTSQLASLKDIDLHGMGLRLVPVRRKTPPRNLGIQRIARTKNQNGAPELTAEVSNQTTSPASAVVRFQLGEQEVRRKVEVPAQSTITVPFTIPKGSSTSEQENLIKIALEDDDFAPDNSYFTKRGSGREISVLIVNGSPRPSRFQDEIFFLTRALESLKADGLEIHLETTTPDNLSAASSLSYDIFILANVHLLPREVVGRLQAQVKEGSGLLISCGDNTDGKFGSRFRDLLVLPFREIHETGSRLGSDEGLSITSVQTRWQGSRELAGAASESLRKARVFRYAVLGSPQPNGPEIKSWIQLENGTPLLLERRLGAGRVMLMATSLDLDWTDLPAHPGYVQLINVLIPHLAGRIEYQGMENLEMGEDWVLKLGEGSTVREARVLPPDSGVTPIIEILASGTQRRVQVHEIRKPGVYTVWLRTEEGRETTRVFTANVRRARGFPTLAQPSEIAKVEHVQTKRTGSRVRPGNLVGSTDVPGTPVWPFILLALILLIAMEALTAIRV